MLILLTLCALFFGGCAFTIRFAKQVANVIFYALIVGCPLLVLFALVQFIKFAWAF